MDDGEVDEAGAKKSRKEGEQKRSRGEKKRFKKHEKRRE